IGAPQRNLFRPYAAHLEFAEQCAAGRAGGSPMKKRFFVSAVVAVAIAMCAFNTMHAQDAPAGPPIPPLAFHVVDNFFHYPAYSVIGRLSGVAVAPNGNVVALNRGYHPV